MINFKTLSPLIIIALLFTGCSSDEGNNSRLSSALLQVMSYDLGDEDQANDIRVTILLDPEIEVTELRAFVVKPGDAGNITAEDAAALSSNFYTTIPIDGTTTSTVRLSTTQVDFDGEAISNGNRYTVMILTYEGDRFAFATASGNVVMEEEPFLNGQYAGTWNDNLYTDFEITASLSVSENTLEGPFYYSGNFTSCCQGNNDGTILFDISDSQIEWSYDQDLVSFMGGSCPGDYVGTGVISDDVTFEINFTGDDCEGAHTGGRLLLSKILN